MKHLVFATNNPHKLSEIRAILGPHVEIASLADISCHEDIPETSATLEGNALEKARYVHRRYGVSCFADDTGLEVEALHGAPGVYTARFGAMNGFGQDHDSEGNTRCLLHMLEGMTHRRARFRTVIALCLEDKEYLFEGIVEGEITTEKRGTRGFGYDPIFQPEGFLETFAQMGPSRKNEISHRARAVKKLAEFLNS